MLFAHLLDASIRSVLLALAAAAVLWALRSKRSPAVAHAIWTIVLCGMLLVFALGPLLPPVPLPVPRHAAPTPVVAVVRGAAPRAAVAPPAGLAPAQPVASAPGNPPPAKRDWRELVSLLYFSIALAFFVRLLVGWLLIWKLARASTAVRDGIYESPSIAVPLSTGARILLPTCWREWDDTTLAAVLAHEAAHVRRRDSLVALVAKLNRCLFWFHPLAWFLDRKLALLAEQACDESSLLAIGDRERYARILLDMAAAVEAAHGRVSWQAVAMAKPSHIRRRIEAILNGTRAASRGLSRAGWAALLLASLPLVYGAAAVKLEQLPAPLALPFPAWSLPGVPAGALQSAAITRVVFRDDFDGTLNPGWQWIDAKGDCTKSLVARKGFLRIMVPSGSRHDLWTGADNYYAPRLVREVDGDFTLETKIAGPVRPKGGLLVWKNYLNFVRFERGIHFKHELYFAAALDGKFFDLAMDYVEGDPTWLRLERKGTTYTASYSLNGRQWHPMSRTFTSLKREVAQDRDDWMEHLNEDDFKFAPAPGSVEMKAKDPLQAGISGLNKNPESLTDFDYFEIRKP